MLVKLETNEIDCVVESSQIKSVRWQKTTSYEVEEKADGSVETHDHPPLVVSRLEFITGGFVEVAGKPADILESIHKQVTEVCGE